MLKLVRSSFSASRVLNNIQGSSVSNLVRKVTTHDHMDPLVKDVKEVSVDWKYIDRLLPLKVVPSFPVKEEYPSGWKPPAASKPSTPYFVRRTANHILPVYINRFSRGQLVLTYIRHIEGDIWELEKDLRTHLESRTNKPIIIQVHEPAGIIKIRREYADLVEEFLYDKGF